MKAIALSCLVVLSACKAKDTAEAAPPSQQPAAKEPAETAEVAPALPKTALELDLDRICNAEEQSGALQLPEGDRALHTGIWLANNIETQEIREFVAELTTLDPKARIARLEETLAKHQISQCEIIKTWGGTS